MYFVCLERSAYWLIWCSVVTYALYQFALVSQQRVNRLDLANFQDGTLTENLYDATDFEWQSFRKLYVNYVYLFLMHFSISLTLTLTQQPALRMAAWILVTLTATLTVFSVGALVVVVVNVIMLVLLAILGKNILSYALCFGVVLASQSTEIANRIFNANDPRGTDAFDFEEKRFLFTYCICFLNARGLSSSLDNLTIKQKKEIQSGRGEFYEKILTIAAYLLYLPGFFGGPIYLYSDFERTTRNVKADPVKEAFTGENYLKSMGTLFYFIVNVFYYEWILHWLYSSAIVSDPNSLTIINSFNSWEFSGFIVSLCLLFYIKYTCIFGAFKMLARFDGIGDVAPPLPQCVAAMHLNSQLWRKFDVGIYNWLRNYIYDPIIGQGDNIFMRILATSMCFFCIGLWHLPLSSSLMLWIILNNLIACVEIWARALDRTQMWTRFKGQMTRANYLRFLALVSIPMFIQAIFSNLFFLADNEHVGYHFIERILGNERNYALYLVLVLYCGASVSLDYNKVVKGPVSFVQSHGLICMKKDTNEGNHPKKTSKKNK